MTRRKSTAEDVKSKILETYRRSNTGAQRNASHRVITVCFTLCSPHAMATPTTQPRNLASLYRLLLRTSQSTFEGDQRMITAWRSYVRQKLPQQAAEKSGGSVSGGTQQKLSDEFVNEWLDVVKMLKMNVVQGVREGPEESYRE